MEERGGERGRGCREEEERIGVKWVRDTEELEVGGGTESLNGGAR